MELNDLLPWILFGLVTAGFLVSVTVLIMERRAHRDKVTVEAMRIEIGLGDKIRTLEVLMEKSKSECESLRREIDEKEIRLAEEKARSDTLETQLNEQNELMHLKAESTGRSHQLLEESSRRALLAETSERQAKRELERLRSRIVESVLFFRDELSEIQRVFDRSKHDKPFFGSEGLLFQGDAMQEFRRAREKILPQLRERLQYLQSEDSGEKHAEAKIDVMSTNES